MSEILAENYSCSSEQSVGENTPKISVIVPVYKVEKYLPECIDSILAQTFTDFELILVDDGSPDNSGKICDDYASRDSRIRVFHKENGGVTSARRFGAENALGEWVIFVDGDDTLKGNTLLFLLNFAVENSADIVESSISPRGKEGGTAFQILNIDDYLRNVVENEVYMAIWGKLIKKDCLSESCLCVPSDIFVYEDFVVNLSLWTKRLNYYKIPEGLYGYRVRQDSVSRTSFVGLEYFKMLEVFVARFLAKCSLKNRMLLRYKWIRAMAYNGISVDREDVWIAETLAFVRSSKKRWKDFLFLFLVRIPFSVVVFRFYKKVFRV